MRKARSIQCWNGQNCYYLFQNRCKFYHPSEHYQMRDMSRYYIQQFQNDPSEKNENKLDYTLNPFMKLVNPQPLNLLEKVLKMRISFSDNDAGEMQMFDYGKDEYQNIDKSAKQRNSSQLAYNVFNKPNNYGNLFMTEKKRSNELQSQRTQEITNQQNISRVQTNINPFARVTRPSAPTLLQNLLSRGNQDNYIPEIQNQVRLERSSNLFNLTTTNHFLTYQRQATFIVLPQQNDLSASLKWFFDRNRHFIIYQQMENREKYDLCSICHSDYDSLDKVTQLYCKHHFHKECISKWFQINTQCPLCKKDFRKHQQYYEFDNDYLFRIEEDQQSWEQQYDYEYPQDYNEDSSNISDDGLQYYYWPYGQDQIQQIDDYL